MACTRVNNFLIDLRIYTVKALEKIILAHWDKKNPFLSLFFKPLAGLFAIVIRLRRLLYRYGILTQYRLPVPVIVIGNIQLGGSGKTPVVIYLAQALTQRGMRVGIISRGYGGTTKNPALVAGDRDNPAAIYGDEPILLAHKSGLPVAVARQKVKAGEFLLQHFPLDVILSDDGLQHYALKRDLEIIVLSYTALYQHPSLLPEGPWREGLKRLQEAQFVLITKIPLRKTMDKKMVASKLKIPEHKIFFLYNHFGPLYALGHPEKRIPVRDLPGGPIAAACAIGEPESFFIALKEKGIPLQASLSYRDHTLLPLEKLRQRYPCVIITEKDAVKYSGVDIEGVYVLSMAIEPENAFLSQLIQKMNNLESTPK